MRAIALILLVFLLPAVAAIPYSNCRQESPNTVNQTGLDNCNVNIYNYGGTYVNNSVTFQGDPAFANDGIYNKSSITTTTQLADVTGEYNFLYVKPRGASRTLTTWRTVNGDVTGTQRVTNHTIPASCWDYSSSTLQVRATSNRWHTSMTWDCRNSTGWQTLYTESTFYYSVYDEAIFWGGDTYLKQFTNEVQYEGRYAEQFEVMRGTGAGFSKFIDFIRVPFTYFILTIGFLMGLSGIVFAVAQALKVLFNKR